MKIMKLGALIFLGAMFFAGFLPMKNAVEAAYLNFTPSTSSVAINGTTNIDIMVDSGTEQVTSTDAYIQYDQTALQIMAVTEGTHFPTVTYDTNTLGRIYIAGIITHAATYKTGKGKLATITVKGLKNASSSMTFMCTAGLTTDSNIAKNDVNATDIIVCTDNNSHQVTIGTGSTTTNGNGTNSQSSSSTSNSTGTGTGSTTGSQTGSTPIPTALPQTGTLQNVVFGSLVGLTLLIIGGLIKFAL